MRKTILERAEQAFDIMYRYNKCSNKACAQRSCIGAAFYLTGVDNEERNREPGFVGKQSKRITRVNSLEDAVMIGAESEIRPGFIGHLMVIYPFDRNKIIHRESANAEMKMENLENALFNFSALVTKGYKLAYFDVE
jgi:hypothetical protein